MKVLTLCFLAGLSLIAFVLLTPAHGEVYASTMPARFEWHTERPKHRASWGGWVQEDYPWSDDGRTGGAGLRWASCAGQPFGLEYELLTNKSLGARADLFRLGARALGTRDSSLWLGLAASGSLGGGQAQDRAHRALAGGSSVEYAFKDGLAPRLGMWGMLEHDGEGDLFLSYKLEGATTIMASARVGPGLRLGPVDVSGGYVWGSWQAPGLRDVLGGGWWGRARLGRGRARTAVEWYPTSGLGEIEKTLMVWRIEWLLGS